jgi:hypothetical protein
MKPSQYLALRERIRQNISKLNYERLKEDGPIIFMWDIEMSRHSQRYNWIDLIPSTPRPTLPTKEHLKLPPAGKYGRARIFIKGKGFIYPKYNLYYKTINLILTYYHKLRRVYKRLMPER